MALSNHSIGILVSRILGIYVFITLIGYFSGIGFYPPAVLIPVVLSLLGLSYVFLLHAPRVATFLMSKTEPTEHKTPLTIERITAAAFIILGVSLLLQTIPQLIGMFTVHPLNELTSRGKDWLIEAVIKLGLSLWLTFGAKGIAVFIERVRSGQPKV